MELFSSMLFPFVIASGKTFQRDFQIAKNNNLIFLLYHYGNEDYVPSNMYTNAHEVTL